MGYGCYNKSSWVEVEVSPAGFVFLNRGWKSFARTHGFKEGHILHFKFDGAAALFVKVFGEAGGRLGCCMESCNSSGHFSSGGSESDDQPDEPPCCRVKVEEESD